MGVRPHSQRAASLGRQTACSSHAQLSDDWLRPGMEAHADGLSSTTIESTRDYGKCIDPGTIQIALPAQRAPVKRAAEGALQLEIKPGK